MSNDELTFPREGTDDPRQALKSHVEAQLGQATKIRSAKLKARELEVTSSYAPDEWEVFAWGPYKEPFDVTYDPGRIIYTDQTAYIAVAVWMNEHMHRVITEHGDKFELNFWTANTQTMEAVEDLSYTCCIHTEQNGPAYYVGVWEFSPTVPACLLETNICVRICNCSNEYLQDYAGFVRHVYDFDPEKLWPDIADFPVTPGSPTPGWGFDRPIRYMVADRQGTCLCDDVEECGPPGEVGPDQPVPPVP